MGLLKGFNLDARSTTTISTLESFRVQGSGFRVQGSGFRVQGCLALALRLARRHRTQQRRDGVVRAKPERGGCFTVERFR